MNQQLPEVEPIPGITGRLWDISKPLLQICMIVSPSRVEELKQALRAIAGQRTEEKRDSIEGQIITTLGELYPEVIAEWTCKVGELLGKLNEARPEGHKLSPQYLGTRLRAMGIPTRHVHGRSEILLPRRDLDALLTQFVSPMPPEDSLPIPTSLEHQGVTTENAGREVVGSCEHSTYSLPGKSVAREGNGSLVESGRELAGSQKEQNLHEPDFVSEDDLEDPAEATPWNC
jgi:hypothetical protein